MPAKQATILRRRRILVKYLERERDLLEGADPSFRQKVLISILNEAIQGLEVLDVNDVRPIFEPGGGKHHGSQPGLARAMQLKAIGHVAVLRQLTVPGQKTKKYSAQDARACVAQPFGVTGDGVRKWRELLMRGMPSKVREAEQLAIRLYRSRLAHFPASEQSLLKTIKRDGEIYRIARGPENDAKE